MLDLVNLLIAMLIVGLVVVLLGALVWSMYSWVPDETRHERKLRRLCQKQDRLRRDEVARKLWVQEKARLEQDGDKGQAGGMDFSCNGQCDLCGRPCVMAKGIFGHGRGHRCGDHPPRCEEDCGIAGCDAQEDTHGS